MNYMKLLWQLFCLRANTKKSRKQLEELKKRKLREIITYAYEHSVYYRRVFEEAGVTKENIGVFPVEKLPVMDKQILMEHFEKLVVGDHLTQESLAAFDEECDDIKKTYKQTYHLVHSSGSTGKPRYYIYDNDAWNQMLVGIIRGALWGMSIREILLLLWNRPRMLYIAATDGRYGGAMAVGDGIDGLKAKQLHLDINTPLEEWCRQIATFRPNIVIGYPSAIKILAELAEKGQIQVKFSRIITCGEPLSRGLRDYLEAIFGRGIVNFYGSSESLALGVETDPSDGMYLFDDMNYVEVIDGQMYITSLYNRIQPLIRYRLSDRLTIRENQLGDSCQFTKVETILGRDEDMMWFEDASGKSEFLHPLAVEGICIEGIIDYQFRQIARDAFELLVEAEKNANRGEIRKKLIALMDTILQKKQLGYVHYSIQYVSKIVPDPLSGKKPLIIRLDEPVEKTGRKHSGMNVMEIEESKDAV